ncbi:hypothetical protein [Bartonella sp. B17]
MIDKKQPKHEQRIVADKTDRKRCNSILKGALAIIFALIIIWFVFGFLGSFLKNF